MEEHNRERTALLELREQILSEFELLQEAVQTSIAANTLSRESFLGAFLSLERQFDAFAALVKNMETPEEIPEFPAVQEEITDCYQKFLDLKKEYEEALNQDGPSEEEPSDGDSEEDPVEDCQSVEEKEEEIPPQKKRSVSPPKKPGAPRQKKARSEKPEEKAADGHSSAYRLTRITRHLGGGAYAVIQNGAYQAAVHTDNDAVRAALNTQYYLSTGAAAAGMVGGILRPPGKKLKTSAAKKLSEKQMAKYNADALRSHRRLTQKIHSLEQQLNSGFCISPAERQQMEEELEFLKASLPESEKSAQFCQRVRTFQQQRALDNQVLDAFTVRGRVPGNARSLHELGTQFLKAQGSDLTEAYGDNFWNTSQKSLRKEIRKSMATAGSLKSQIDLLQRQGQQLSVDDRRHLLALKQQKQALGRTVQKLRSQEDALKNYAYVSSQVNQVLNRADKLSRNTSASMNFLRNTIIRPLCNSENDTTFLAYEARVLSDPRIVRALYKAPEAALHGSYQILKKAAPKFVTRLRYQQDRKARQEKEQKARRKQEQQAPREPDRKEPGPAQQPSPEATASTPPLTSGEAAQDTLRKKLKQRLSTESGRKAHRFRKPSAESAKKAAVKTKEVMTTAFKKANGKFALILAGILLLIVLLFGLISAIGEAGMSVIFSPHEGENGKIDLRPYLLVITQEKQKLMSIRETLEQDFYEEIEEKEAAFNRRYQDPPRSQIVGGEDYQDKYSKINLSFDGPYANDRELISMMAVRFQQDLEDPDAQRYLRYMASKARTLLTASDKTYQHQPGCVSVRFLLKEDPTEPVETRPPEGGSQVIPGIRSIVRPGGSQVIIPTKPTTPPKYEILRLCPGHRELELSLHVLTLEELMAADDWEGGPPEWEGWTEENREWVQLFLDMDWTELYTGFRPGSMIPIRPALPPEQERHIWERLENMTGNPFAAAGIMGNLHCESRLLSSNLEDSHEPILGYSDQTYTEAVDSGSYGNFIHDAAGYGLAQWTYYSRKEGLLNLARSRGTSISDLDMQLDYLEQEFQNFGMMGSLQAMSSVEEASDYILFQFERPELADELQPTRAGISSYFYNKYMYGSTAEGNLTQAQMDVIHIATNSDAYGIAATGGYCQAWAANVYGAAGFPIDTSSCARVSGERYGVSSDFTVVPPGAAVYGHSSHFGHVGIYVGGGLVYHNVGGVAVDTLADWVRKYNGFCWGWEAGTDLTALP